MGRVFFGLLFIVLLPAALISWAHATNGAVHIPTPRWPLIGWGLGAGGTLLMIEAMRELWVRGGGLPMNAYPPKRLVATGVYAVFPHPIYVGCCIACVGVSLATGSSAGLWLISPVAIAGCTALVMGYEGAATSKRFGGGPRPWLRPPEQGDARPVVRDRLSVYILLFAPWLLLYEGWGHAQTSHLTAFLPGESHWPVWERSTYVYSLAYPFTMAVPLVLRRCGDLRRFFNAGVVALAASMLIYVALPVHSPPRGFDRDAAGGWLLALEHSDGLSGAVALPSYHVVWIVLIACAYTRRGSRWGAAAWTFVAGISAACITTGMHAVADVAVALPVAAFAWHWPRVWSLILSVCERIANSWSCARIGPVRIINYAAYAGLAAGVGMFIAQSLSGQGWRLAVIALVSLAAAGLWGQVLVGSPTLLRPFGYFGAILGAALGLGWVAALEGTSQFWMLAAALCIAAPWIVLIGRFRCLIQGCCHGHAIDREGIRYRHPHSRACLIAHLRDVPVHPTPLYSMIDNAVIGLVLGRLWWAGAALSMIAGVYLILAGMTRFVEESTRGEPQTQIVAGLRIYQWLAMASVIAGACVTTLHSAAAPQIVQPSWTALAWALAIGLAFAFAMGVDFPSSNRRFSRLV